MSSLHRGGETSIGYGLTNPVDQLSNQLCAISFEISLGSHLLLDPLAADRLQFRVPNGGISSSTQRFDHSTGLYKWKISEILKGKSRSLFFKRLYIEISSIEAQLL